METEWMISIDYLDALSPDTLYELGWQIVEALNRRAYATECLTEAMDNNDKDTDMDT